MIGQIVAIEAVTSELPALMEAIPWLSTKADHLPELPQQLDLSSSSGENDDFIITGLPTRAGTNSLPRPKIKITTTTSKPPAWLPVAEPLTGGGTSNQVYDDGKIML